MAPQPLSFDGAIELVRDGQSISDTTRLLLLSLTTAEKLSILTGPMQFWPGVKELLGGNMNKVPYILGPIDRLGIPGIRFCDGPRGIVIGESTCFPVAMARGATWDTALEERVGEVMAAECRAHGANTFGGICINLPRHPAWGRIQETYGEDPILLGEFGLAMTKSMQRNGVIACVKHFALNSMEDMRFKVDVNVDDAALHEVYLSHFEMLVKEGKAMSVMSAYNSVNGEWCGQNALLLDRILRKEWGFEYFTISDWVFGLRDSVKSIKNGLDLEAPFAQVRNKLQKEFDQGNITIEEVDRSATRLLASQLELYSQRSTQDPDKSIILCQEHRNVAREVAAKSMVLLKNEAVPQLGSSDVSKQPLLPIDIQKVTKCAVIGILADKHNTGDRGSSHVRSPQVITPYAGIKNALSTHGATTTLTTSNNVQKAVEAARAADFAVLVVGYDAMDEGENLSASAPMSLIPWPNVTELIRDVPSTLWSQFKATVSSVTSSDGPSPGGKAGGDRRSLRLPTENVSLIRAVTKANPRTIVAIIASGAVLMEEWINDANTVLMSWYSGCEGGDALADVIFGRVDASGRLPFSIPKDERDLPSFDARAKEVTYDKWFGQRLLDRDNKVARFPLGHGRSYTTFNMTDLQIQQSSGRLNIQVKVTNIGTRAGRHVVQVYGLPQDPGEDFPTRVLLGFQVVDLPAGECRVTDIVARTRPLQRWQNGGFVFASPKAGIEVGSHAGDRVLYEEIVLESST